jgi:hypothetical protein
MREACRSKNPSVAHINILDSLNRLAALMLSPHHPSSAGSVIVPSNPRLVASSADFLKPKAIQYPRMDASTPNPSNDCILTALELDNVDHSMPLLDYATGLASSQLQLAYRGTFQAISDNLLDVFANLTV